jgi:hypothetical protein
MTLLMTAPYTDPTHAHNVVMTAGSANERPCRAKTRNMTVEALALPGA